MHRVEPNLEYTQLERFVVAELIGGTVQTERDATDLVGNASFGGATHALLSADQLAPEFFDLSTGLAGAIMQKFATYRLVLVVSGFDASSASDSLRALMVESNRGSVAWFVADREEALARVGGG